MPMWITWMNPGTMKRESIYNYFDPESPEGRTAIEIARRSLSRRFGIPETRIPGFLVSQAQWIPVRPAPDGVDSTAQSSPPPSTPHDQPRPAKRLVHPVGAETPG